MFVTANVEEEKRSIVQTVIVSFLSESLEEYLQLITKLSSSIRGWLYENKVMERGYLCDTDFPEWLEKDEIVKNIMISRSRLFYAHHKKISEGGNYQSIEPVRFYKTYRQVRYNIAKPGLNE